MKKILTFGLPIVALLGLIGWRISGKKAEEADLQRTQQARKGSAPNVVLAVAGPKEIVQSLESVGTVESPFNVNLSPKVAGRINLLTVREGASVIAGQALVEIDPAEIEGQILQAQSQAAEARSRLAEARINQNPTSVAVTSQIRQQRAGVASSRADFNQVQQNYASQVATAQSGVTDAAARVSTAESAVETALASLTSARANLANSQTKFKRADTLVKQGYISQQEADNALTDVQVAQAAVSVADAQVNAARSAVRSAKAVQASAESQLQIVKKKGLADIEAARAKVVQSDAQLDVANANRAQEPAYRANLAALGANLAAAEANVRQVEARRNDLVLRSPIDGTVTQRSLDPGAVATPGQTVLTIQYLKWLYVNSSLPVEYADRVTPGTEARVTFDALPGRTFTARVAEVNKSADPLSRQFSIRLRLENSAGLLRPGMFARLNLVLEKDQAAVVVPREAVAKAENGDATVMAVDNDNTAHKTPVKTGPQDAASIAITDGIPAGTKVVVLSYAPVKDGGKVKEGSAGAGGSRRGRPGGRT